MIPRSKALLSLFLSLVLAPMLTASSEVEVAVASAPEQVVQSSSTDLDDAATQVAEMESPLPTRPPHAGTSENIFSGHSWYKPPPPPPKRVAAAPVARKPVAPPLPYTFLGSYEQAGSPTLYFLVKGDRTYDVRIGDTLDDTYSVDDASDGQLMFTYLPLDTSQGLRLRDP